MGILVDGSSLGMTPAIEDPTAVTKCGPTLGQLSLWPLLLPPESQGFLSYSLVSHDPTRRLDTRNRLDCL